MKYFISFVLCTVFLVPLSFSQVTVSSEIKEVIAFSDQALVTRKAEASVSKGLRELHIETEAFWVDPDSIQARVYGKGEIHSVQLRTIHLKDVPQEKLKKLIQELEGLKDKKAEIAKEREVLTKEEKFLDSLVNFAKIQLPKDIKTSFPKPKDLKEAVNFLSEGYEQINEDEIDISQELRELDKEIRALQNEIASLRRPNQKAKKVIEVVFNSPVDQKIKIEATYLVSGVWWQPLYKVDVPLELKKINLTMFSQLKQKTGEDWKDIKLAISNVIPLKGAHLPNLESWLLDFQRYQKKSRNLSLSRLASGSLKEKAEFEADFAVEGLAQPVQEEAKFTQAIQKELPLSFEYQIPQSLSIESKDKETTLPLFSKTLKGDFFHYSVPKVSQLVFLTSRVTPDKELLGGRLNVYFTGRFIGKTALEAKKAGESFDINLGADREVVVKREKLKDKVQETFFKKIERQTVIRNLLFKITLENRKNKPVKVHLIDAIPVSKTDRIEVKEVKIAPRPTKANYKDKQGVNLWMVNLNPGEKKEITIGFTVTYPKDRPVVGL